MLNDEVRFRVELKDLVLTASELADLVQFLRDKKFIFRDYVGSGKGYLGEEYNYKFVGHDERNRCEITPMNDALWLYLNTFGKEE
jgi:hypothetical protein